MPALTPFLRKALLTDAIVSTAATVMMIAGSGFLADPLGLPSAVLLWAGMVCVPFVALLAFILRAGAASTALMSTVIALNFVWVAASLYIAFGPSFSPTLLGQVFVCAQAATVLLFAELQIIGMRRPRLVA